MLFREFVAPQNLHVTSLRLNDHQIQDFIDQEQNFGLQFVLLISAHEISVAKSEMHEWKSGCRLLQMNIKMLIKNVQRCSTELLPMCI